MIPLCADNMVGSVPLIKLCHFFWARRQQSVTCNSTPTIRHMFSKHKDSCFPCGCADAAATDGRRGSNVCEVNPWLWQFGRGRPRLGGLTIVHTSKRKDAVSNARPLAQVCSRDSMSLRLQPDSKYMVLYDSMYECVRVCTSTYEYIRVCISIIMVCKIHDLHNFFSLLAPKYNVLIVLCLGGVPMHL